MKELNRNNQDVSLKEVGHSSASSNEISKNKADFKANFRGEPWPGESNKEKLTDKNQETGKQFGIASEIKTDKITDKSTKEDNQAKTEKNKLPECFNYLSDTDKSKQMSALDKMSDKERNTYLNIAEKEPKITKDVKEVAQANGADLGGLDYRLKTPSSTYEKMHERSSSVDVGKMNDVIRYTEIYPPDKLAAGTNLSLKSFEEKGYTVEKVKNTWNDENNPYKGINSTLKSPDGQKFEVQFHTQESFDLKNGEMHKLYEKERTLSPKDTARQPIRERMFELSNSLTKPDNISEVKNK